MGLIKTYRFSKDGRSLELIHSTACEDIPGAFSEYRGKLVAGVGNVLRVYELGMKKLLRKLENKSLTSPIVSIKVEDSGRIFAADISESVHVFKCKPDD
jgi:splicing factor 3B subunit 3